MICQKTIAEELIIVMKKPFVETKGFKPKPTAYKKIFIVLLFALTAHSKIKTGFDQKGHWLNC
jgi:hypothetical protein